MIAARRILLLLPGVQFRYLFRAEFGTAVAAPLPSPYTAEPGPGQLSVIDTENKLSIAGGRLRFSGGRAAPAFDGDPSIRNSVSSTRAAGLAMAVTINQDATTGVKAAVGWAVASGGDFDQQILYFHVAGFIFAQISGAGFYLNMYAAATDYQVAVVLRTAGCFILIKGGAYTDWSLLWVDNGNVVTPLWAGVGNYDSAFYADDLRIIQLAGPWTSPYGLATSYIASPASGDIASSQADAVLEVTWTPAGAQTLEWMTRRTDDDNCWIVRCSRVGGTIKLIEKVAGVETERNSAAQTWTIATPYRIVITQRGVDFRLNVADVDKGGYGAASFQQTATGVKISGHTAAANLVCWPGTVSLRI